jgi:hypothetical protein
MQLSKLILNPIPRSDHRRLILTRIRQWAITRRRRGGVVMMALVFGILWLTGVATLGPERASMALP